MSGFNKRKIDAVGKSPNGKTLKWDEKDDFNLEEIVNKHKMNKLNKAALAEKQKSKKASPEQDDGWLEKLPPKKYRGGKNTLKNKRSRKKRSCRAKRR